MFNHIKNVVTRLLLLSISRYVVIKELPDKHDVKVSAGRSIPMLKLVLFDVKITVIVWYVI